jgi:hypothetical protein
VPIADISAGCSPRTASSPRSSLAEDRPRTAHRYVAVRVGARDVRVGDD